MHTATVCGHEHSGSPDRRPLLCTLPSDERLRPDAAAAALTGYTGTPVSVKTLANARWLGTGPVYQKFGRYVTYRAGDLRTWADERMGAPVRSTSEQGVR
jgi:hypothetical protein